MFYVINLNEAASRKRKLLKSILGCCAIFLCLICGFVGYQAYKMALVTEELLIEEISNSALNIEIFTRSLIPAQKLMNELGPLRKQLWQKPLSAAIPEIILRLCLQKAFLQTFEFANNGNWQAKVVLPIPLESGNEQAEQLYEKAVGAILPDISFAPHWPPSEIDGRKELSLTISGTIPSLPVVAYDLPPTITNISQTLELQRNEINRKTIGKTSATYVDRISQIIARAQTPSTNKLVKEMTTVFDTKLKEGIDDPGSFMSECSRQLEKAGFATESAEIKKLREEWHKDTGQRFRLDNTRVRELETRLKTVRDTSDAMPSLQHIGNIKRACLQLVDYTDSWISTQEYERENSHKTILSNLVQKCGFSKNVECHPGDQTFNDNKTVNVAIWRVGTKGKSENVIPLESLRDLLAQLEKAFPVFLVDEVKLSFNNNPGEPGITSLSVKGIFPVVNRRKLELLKNDLSKEISK